MKRYNSYAIAEHYLIQRIVDNPDFVTSVMHERIGDGFILTDPCANKNSRSNYEYAEKFFQWMMTGEKWLSTDLLELNPWVRRFVSNTGLPETFSSSYGWKIQAQLPKIIQELKDNANTRRAYINILYEEDHVILPVKKATMEYPCTIGLHFFIRDQLLNLTVNMRSNNVFAVMPYDVYLFTNLQKHIATLLDRQLGVYQQLINSAHIYNGDVKRIIKNQNNEQITY